MGILDRLAAAAANYFSNRTQAVQAATETRAAHVPSVPKVKIYGNQGRLEIPDLDISVPLYDTSTGGAQQIVDKKDSAVLLRWNVQNAIADHSDQCNFSNLSNAVVGGTTMSIETQNSSKRYRCVRSQVGHIKTTNGSNQIFDENWNSPYTQNAGGICIYTCLNRSAPDIMDIRLTYWQPVD